MDDEGGRLFWSVLLTGLLLVDFLMAMYGAALQSVSENTLEQKRDEGAPAAGQVLDLKDHTEFFIRACWFYPILTALPGWFFIRSFNRPYFIPAMAGVFILVYLFGKSLPVQFGRKYDSGVVLRFYRIIRLAVYASFPFTWIMNVMTTGIARICGIRPSDVADEVTEDEIISMVNEGHEQGVLDEHEAEMIQNIFRLDDKDAQDIMTHRKNIEALRADSNLNEAISFMVGESNSRFPVYDGDIDNIIGVLHFKDAMIAHNRGEYDNWMIRDIPDLVRPVHFIPETRSIDQLFRSMQSQKAQMVIVVDEYGQTAGLVTMEDILEEIVGNILDEYDEEEALIIPEENGTFRMAGMTPLEEVEETLHIRFQEDDYDTLNGYLVSRLDRIPEEDEHSIVEEQNWLFEIQQVENKTIRWVKVSPQTKE